MSEAGINIKGIDFAYPEDSGTGGKAAAGGIFADFSIELPHSKVSVILGPSGCGKTTLLNLISGLLKPSKGEILSGESEAGQPGFSVLFQEPRLLPWRNIRRNIEIVLEKQYGKTKACETAEHYLNLVGLEEYAEYFPSGLSGGMRQRAAIARAFAFPAGTILMDEPFQALDLRLKISLTSLFTKLWIEDRRTAVFVTHDINEAVLLGDEIFVFSGEHPIRIVDHISNTEPHASRNLESEVSMKIERRLYHLLG